MADAVQQIMDGIEKTITIPAPEAGATYLLSTLWSQSGKVKIGSKTDKTITYNYYCPLDTTKTAKSVTGCTNTAAAQIIYYFIEKKGLNLTLKLDQSDEYTSTKNGFSCTIKADGSTNGTISFNEINAKLLYYDTKSADDAAALLYACGVVQKANYSSSGTGTAWKESLFRRAGFVSVNRSYPMPSYWGTGAYENFVISDAGFEVIIENIKAGRVVGTSYPGHAIVIDGYDAATDKFHINYGWGNDSATSWYTRKEIRDAHYYEFVYDLMVEKVTDISVSDNRVYGTGTLIRAMEQVNSIEGYNRMVFTKKSYGKTVTPGIMIKFGTGEAVDVVRFNMDLRYGSDSHYGFYDYSGESNFYEFKGSLALNQSGSSSSGYAIRFISATNATTVNDLDLARGVIYAGNYYANGSYENGTAKMISDIRYWQNNKLEASESAIASIGNNYAVSTYNALNMSLRNRSYVLGSVVGYSKNDNLTLSNSSRLYGRVSLYDGTNTITIDSTSAINGSFSNNQTSVKLLLTANKSNTTMLTVQSSISSFKSYYSCTADVTRAVNGTYKLIAAGSDAVNKSYLNSLSVKVNTSAGAFTMTSGSSRTLNGITYSLQNTSDTITLSVSGSKYTEANSNIKVNGTSQIIAWDRNRGAVGMVANAGKSAPAWQGVWDWNDKDAKLWQVAGTGHFKGSKKDYDGVLLYNGIGNTFAAWTDLNTGSYGYVNLCHVDGNFSTVDIGNFDNNVYDDILIKDDRGSFGVVLDGSTYRDIWHVSDPATNNINLLGAGNFGDKNGVWSLVVQNTATSECQIWYNNDPSFRTWNWRADDIPLAKMDSNMEIIAIGDFQGDGLDDILFMTKNDRNIWAWDDGNSTTKRWCGTLDKNFAVETVGDYNGDNKDDLLLREQSSGWGGLGYWGAGYAGNWTDMRARIETDTRISGSKFDIIA